MRRLYLLSIVALGFFFFAFPPAEAAAQVTFGPQVVLWDFEEIGVGARADFELDEAFGIEEGAMQGLFGSFEGNYLFTDGDVTILVFDLNASVPFETETGLSPYAGAGINHLRSSFEGGSASGLNLLGGLFLDMGGIPGFAELQYSTTGLGFLTLSGGVMFGG